jgi:hypothetical protein
LDSFTIMIPLVTRFVDEGCCGHDCILRWLIYDSEDLAMTFNESTRLRAATRPPRALEVPGAGWARSVPMSKVKGTSTARNFGGGSVSLQQPAAEGAAEPVKRRVIVSTKRSLSDAAKAAFDAHCDETLMHAYWKSETKDLKI